VVDKFALIKHISKKPPTFSSTGISNRGVHNITNLATTSPYRELTQAEINTLSLGLKHIITPNSIEDTAILEDFNKYRRSIRLRFQFFNSPPIDNIYYTIRSIMSSLCLRLTSFFYLIENNGIIGRVGK
jgi:hypothetical protein